MTALLVALGAALGAPARHLVQAWARSRGASVAGALLLINVSGSLLLGVIARTVHDGAPVWLLALIGVGFCGAFTTFAGHALEVATAAREARARHAALDLGLSLVLGLAAASLGWAVA